MSGRASRCLSRIPSAGGFWRAVVLGSLAACSGASNTAPQTSASEPTPTRVGAFCTTDADCGEGHQCYDYRQSSTWVPDGYCLLRGGGCMLRNDCPPGTRCAPLPFAEIPGVCMLACDDDADCREGYACQTVELFPGDPEGPQSDGTVCWTQGYDLPPPEPGN
jgi:hypothetical protein